MVIQRLSYRNAFYLALAFTTLLNVILLLMFFYVRNAAISSEVFEYAEIPISTRSETTHLIFNFVTTFIISFILCAMNFRLFILDIKPKTRMILVIVSTTVVTILLSYFFSSVQLYLKDLVIWSSFRATVIRDTFIGLFMLLISFLAYVFTKQQQTALEVTKNDGVFCVKIFLNK